MRSKTFEQVKSFYDTIHADYRVLKSRPHFQTDMIEKFNMIKMVGSDLAGKKLLDVGCGLGFHLREYAVRGALTCGMDLCEKHIEFASGQSPSSRFLLGDFLDHDFQEERFDIVTASLVLNYFVLPDKARFFKKVHAVLEKGGFFFFSEKNPVVEGLDFVKVQEDDFLETWKIRAKTEGYFSENKKKTKPYYGSEMIKFHASFQAIIGLLLEGGFTIRGYSDCYPNEQSIHMFPEEFAYYSRIPQFFIFKVCKE